MREFTIQIIRGKRTQKSPPIADDFNIDFVERKIHYRGKGKQFMVGDLYKYLQRKFSKQAVEEVPMVSYGGRPAVKGFRTVVYYEMKNEWKLDLKAREGLRDWNCIINLTNPLAVGTLGGF